MACFHVAPQLALAPLAGIDRAARKERSSNELSLASRGPGWFDSSWELGRGLDVHEGVPDNLGVNEWLALCLVEPMPALR